MPGRHPAARPWSRRRADTQRRLCARFIAPVIGAICCQDIRVADMQQIVNSAPTAGEGDRLHRCLSAMVTAGITAGYLASARLREVHWQAGDRAAPGPQVSIAGEAAQFTDPAEIPAGTDVARLGRALAAGRRGHPTAPEPLVLRLVDPSPLVETPERLLGLAADLLLSGETVRGGEYLDLLDHAGKIPAESRLAARFAAFQSFRYGVSGQLEEAVRMARAARAIQERTQLTDEWNAVVPLVLIRVYTCLDDFPAVEREAAAALAAPEVPDPVKLVMVPGSLALAQFESGRLAEAADTARAADADARRLGFGQHFFAVDILRALSGLALERRDLDTAEHVTEQVLSITEQRRPLFEFLALLDRARIWAARGQVRDALTTVEAARQAVPAGASPALLARADEQEALLRLSLGDPRTAAELARRLPAARRALLLARVALAAGDHHAVHEHLQAAAALGDLTPRHALVRQLLLAAAAIERGDPAAASLLGGALHTARSQGFLNTVITTAPQVTGYLVEHAAPLRPDPFTEQLVAAALEVRATQPGPALSSRVLAEPLTAAEQRILTLLPTSTYLQIADTLYISRNTVKTHLRSIYQKLGVASRSEALQRAADLRLL